MLCQQKLPWSSWEILHIFYSNEGKDQEREHVCLKEQYEAGWQDLPVNPRTCPPEGASLCTDKARSASVHQGHALRWLEKM